MGEEQPRWVTECGNCTLDKQFRTLIKIVARDVEEMNELPEKVRRHYTFHTENKTDDAKRPVTTVHRVRPEENAQRICSFLLDQHHIVVSPRRQDAFDVRVKWAPKEGKCRLYLKDSEDPLPLWKISQNVLAPEFFDLEIVTAS